MRLQASVIHNVFLLSHIACDISSISETSLFGYACSSLFQPQEGVNTIHTLATLMPPLNYDYSPGIAYVSSNYLCGVWVSMGLQTLFLVHMYIN